MTSKNDSSEEGIVELVVLVFLAGMIISGLIAYFGFTEDGKWENIYQPQAYSKCYRIPTLSHFYKQTFGKDHKWKIDTACKEENPFMKPIKASDDGIIGYYVHACPDDLAESEAGGNYKSCNKEPVICQKLPCKLP